MQLATTEGRASQAHQQAHGENNRRCRQSHRAGSAIRGDPPTAECTLLGCFESLTLLTHGMHANRKVPSTRLI